MSENSVYSVLACPSNSFPRTLQWNQVLQWREASFLTTGAKPVTLGVLTFGVSLGLLLLFVKVLLLESPPPLWPTEETHFLLLSLGLYREAACWLLELFRQVPKCGPQASRFGAGSGGLFSFQLLLYIAFSSKFTISVSTRSFVSPTYLTEPCLVGIVLKSPVQH